MKRALIKIEPAAEAQRYVAKLFNVDESGPVEPPLTQGSFAVTQQLLDLKSVLPGDTPASALDDEGLKLYLPLYAALGQPLPDLLAGEAASIHLELCDDELRRLPWEIMVWSNDAMGVLRTRVRAKHSIARVWKMVWGAAQVRGGGPLRVLIAIGDSKNIAADEERTEIRRRVQRHGRAIDLEAKVFTSKDDLYSAVNAFRPHVLHFIGHGTSDRLMFTDWSWSLADIGDVGGLALKGWKPGLVFLNACRSAKGLDEQAPLSAAFLANGAQAVVAMQGDIQGRAAGMLAGAFYEQLAAGQPIDAALAKARAAAGPKAGEKEISYPALILRVPAAAALPCFLPLAETYLKRMKFCNILPVLDVFMNQTAPKREICSSLWPYREEQSREPFILLRGAASRGKTTLSGWLLDLAIRLGHRVRYVNVGNAPTLDFVTILELIWGGPPGEAGQRSPLLNSLPLDPQQWTAKFEAAKQDKDVAIYVDFRKALAQISSTDQPLTIVLDNILKNIDKGAFWYFWEHFLLDIGRELKYVNLLLALNEDDHQYYEIEDELEKRSELRSYKMVPLPTLPSSEFYPLWKEYLFFRSQRFMDAKNASVVETYVQRGLKEDKSLTVAQFEQKTKWLAPGLEIDLPALPRP